MLLNKKCCSEPHIGKRLSNFVIEWSARNVSIHLFSVFTQKKKKKTNNAKKSDRLVLTITNIISLLMPNHSFWWSHPSGGIISLSQCLTWRWAHSWIPHHCLRRKKIINNLRERLRTISPKTTFPPCPSMSYYKWVKSGTILILLYCFVKGMTWSSDPMY